MENSEKHSNGWKRECMIRITRHFSYKTTCKKCGTEFICENEDLVEFQTRINEFKNYVRCPVCGKEIEVK